MGKCQPGEEHIIRDFTFGRVATHAAEQPQRDLLLDFCESTGTVIAKTLFDVAIAQKATFMEPGSIPLGRILEDLLTQTL